MDEFDDMAQEEAAYAAVRRTEVPDLRCPTGLTARKPVKSTWCGVPGVCFEFARSESDMRHNRRRIVIYYWPEGSGPRNGDFPSGSYDCRMVSGDGRTPDFNVIERHVVGGLPAAQAVLEILAMEHIHETKGSA